MNAVECLRTCMVCESPAGHPVAQDSGTSYVALWYTRRQLNSLIGSLHMTVCYLIDVLPSQDPADAIQRVCHQRW